MIRRYSEKELIGKHPIIAPDGYIPNSIIKRKIKPRKVKTPPKPKTDDWTLKPVPSPNPKHLPSWWGQAQAAKERETPPPRFLLYEDTEDESPRSVTQTPVKKPRWHSDASTSSTASSPISPKPTSPKKCHKKTRGSGGPQAAQKRPVQRSPTISSAASSASGIRKVPVRSKPGTPIKSFGSLRVVSPLMASLMGVPRIELALSSPDPHRGLGTPDSRRRLGTPDSMRALRRSGSHGSQRSLIRSKSMKLTDMVVDENSTEVHLKESSRRSRIPGMGNELLFRIMGERWFPKLEGPLSLESIVDNLIALLDNSNENIRQDVSMYIMSIQREVGLPEPHIDKLIDKLMNQMNDPDEYVRHDALQLLQELGSLGRTDIIMKILPKLINSEESVRLAAAEALGEITGLGDKETLLQMLADMGEESEETRLKLMADKLREMHRPGSFYDRIQNWIDETEMSTRDFTDEELKRIDVDRLWQDGRTKKQNQSMYLSDQFSEDRMRELSFLSNFSDQKSFFDQLDRTMDMGTPLTIGSIPSDMALSRGVSQYTARSAEGWKSERERSRYNRLELMDRAGASVMPGEREDPDIFFSDAELSPVPNDISGAERNIDLNLVSENTFTTNVSLVGPLPKFVSSAKTTHDAVSIDSAYSLSETDQHTAYTEMEGFSENVTVSHLESQHDQDSEISDAHFDDDVSEIRKSEKSTRPTTHMSDEDWTPGSSPVAGDPFVDYFTSDMYTKKLEALEDSDLLSDRSDSCQNIGRSTSRSRITTEKTLTEWDENEFESEASSNEEEEMEELPDFNIPTGELGEAETPVPMDALADGPSLKADLTPTDLDRLSPPTLSQLQLLDQMETPKPQLVKSGPSVDLAEFNKRTIKSTKRSASLRLEKHLSPVHSAKSEKPTSPIRQRPPSLTRAELQQRIEDLHKFLELPNAQERKRLDMVRKEAEQGKLRQKHLPPITYLTEDLPIMPGEAGIRLLQTVRVTDKLPPLSVEGKHMIDPIPGKLSIHTRYEDEGLSNYGIIQMQWTTGIPDLAAIVHPHLHHRPHHQSHPATPPKANLKSVRSHISHMTKMSKSHDSLHIPELVDNVSAHKLHLVSSEEDVSLPSLAVDRKSIDLGQNYEWKHPIPPVTKGFGTAEKTNQSEKYKAYYRQVKKNLHFATVRPTSDLHLPDIVAHGVKNGDSTSRSSKKSSVSRKTTKSGKLSPPNMSQTLKMHLPPIKLGQLVQVC